MCNGINPIRHAAIDTAVLGIEYIINIFFTPLLCTCWLIMYIVHKSIGECDFWVFKNVIYIYNSQRCEWVCCIGSVRLYLLYINRL